jgi:hypothetical protein
MLASIGTLIGRFAIHLRPYAGTEPRRTFDCDRLGGQWGGRLAVLDSCQRAGVAVSMESR